MAPLALIYNYCTKPFDTTDLEEAKVWLNELGLSILALGV